MEFGVAKQVATVTWRQGERIGLPRLQEGVRVRVFGPAHDVRIVREREVEAAVLLPAQQQRPVVGAAPLLLRLEVAQKVLQSTDGMVSSQSVPLLEP